MKIKNRINANKSQNKTKKKKKLRIPQIIKLYKKKKNH